MCQSFVPSFTSYLLMPPKPTHNSQTYTQQPTHSNTSMQHALLVCSVLWDFLSAYAIVASRNTTNTLLRLASARHTDCWSSPHDNTSRSRHILANYIAILACLRCLAFIDTSLHIIAQATYAWELFWLLTGVYCDAMSLPRVMPSVCMCLACILALSWL